MAIVKAEHIDTKGFGCLALVVKCAIHQNEVNKIEMTAEIWTNALFFCLDTFNSCCQRFLCLLVVNFSNQQILDNRILEIIVRPFFKISYVSICLSGLKAEQILFVKGLKFIVTTQKMFGFILFIWDDKISPKNDI